MGCDLEAHGTTCMHLYYHLLKTGDIAAYYPTPTLSIEQHVALSEPNEPREEHFRSLLEPYVSDTKVKGHITKYQSEILVLRFVYDMSFASIATELNSSINTVQVHLSKALDTLKPFMKEILKNAKD